MKASPAAVEAPVALAPSTDRAYINRIVLLFCCGWCIVYLDRTILYPLIPIVKQDMGLTAAQAGWIMGIYFLMYAPMHGAGGIIGDWLGIKRVVVAFMGLAGFGLLLLGSASTYPMLLAAVAIHGLGVGANYVGAYGITMQTVPTHLRGVSGAIVNSGMSLGLVAGLLSADPLYQAFGSWRFPFVVLAIPTLAIAGANQLLIRPVARQAFSLGGVGAFFRDRQLVCLGAAGFTVIYGYFVILQWGPTFFQTERGFGILKSGLFTAMIAVTALPAGLVWGRLSDRLGRKPLSFLLLPLGALCLILLPLVRSQTMLFLVLILYGVVGKLGWDPVMFAWMGDRVTGAHPSSVRGTTIGVFGCVIMLGAFVAPIVTGWIRDLTGSLVIGFYLSGVLPLLGMLLLLVPQETIRRLRH